MSEAFSPRDADILWELEARHLDEAQFTFELWEDTLDSPDHTLDELADGVERRLLSHVDGLAVGGPAVASRLLVPTMRSSDTWAERIAAAVLAAEEPGVAIEALGTATEDEQVRGLMRGLELREDPGLDTRLLAQLPETPSAALLEVLARRRVRVEAWPEVVDLEVADSARAAARLARACADPRALRAVGALAQHDDPMVRGAALDTALLRGVPGAWESVVYWAFTDRDNAGRREDLVKVACLGDGVARRRVIGCLDDPQLRADALWAAGFCGSVAAVERCLALLDDDDLGPFAAEVVCAVAGLPTDEPGLWREAPLADGPEAGLPPLGSDNLDESLGLAPEDFLPVPEPDAIREWWSGRAGEFDPTLRYVGGRVMDVGSVAHALRWGPLRRRHWLAVELELRSGGAAYVATRALSRAQVRQLDELGRRGDLGRLDFQRGLG